VWAAPIQYQDPHDTKATLTRVGPCVDTWMINDTTALADAAREMGYGVAEYLHKCRMLTTFGVWVPFAKVNPFHPLTSARFSEAPSYGMLLEPDSVAIKEVIHTMELEQRLHEVRGIPMDKASTRRTVNVPEPPSDDVLALPRAAETRDIKRRVRAAKKPPLQHILRETGLTTKTLRWIFLTVGNLGAIDNLWMPKLVRFAAVKASTFDYNPPVLCVFEDADGHHVECWTRKLFLTSPHVTIKSLYRNHEESEAYQRALEYNLKYNKEFNE